MRRDITGVAFSGKQTSMVLVVIAVIFNLWALRAERLPVAQLNDGAMHTQMIRWAADRIDEGHVPLDGWYPYFALGSAQFHHYPSLPHALLGPVALVLDADLVYSWSVYLLLALWPAAVYLGARGFGWDPLSAGCAALIAPLIVSAPGYGFEYNSYTWQGLGLYSQLWGMLALPIALRLAWTGIERGGVKVAWGALAIAVATALNYLTGYLLLACVLGWFVLVARRENGVSKLSALLVAMRGRIGRGLGVVVGGLIGAAWVLVPLVADARWTNLSPEFAGHFWLDSFGARRVLSWLFSGELFDAGRLPVITILVALGLVAMGWDRAHRRGALALGVVGVVSLVLFFGRPTWGSLISVLPGGDDLMLPRFIVGLHMAGIFFAGAGLAALARWTYSLAGSRLSRPPWLAYAAASIAMVAVLITPFTERSDYHERGAAGIANQQVSDATDGRDLGKLLDLVKDDGGRAYAGSRVDGGENYRVGSVPVYAQLAHHDIDALGFTYRTISSLSSDLEPRFDTSDVSEYDLYNVRYLILPADLEPLVEAAPIAREGRHALWQVPTSGYLRVVETSDSITADRSSIAAASEAFLAGDDAELGIFPAVAYDGRPAGPSVRAAGEDQPPGEIVQQVALVRDGHFVGRVRAARRAVVLLKTSFHPRWSATVDGAPAEIVMVAPSFMGVVVGPGEHVVEFRYVSFRHHGVLVALGGMVLLLIVLLSRRAPRLARRARRG